MVDMQDEIDMGDFYVAAFRQDHSHLWNFHDPVEEYDDQENPPEEKNWSPR